MTDPNEAALYKAETTRLYLHMCDNGLSELQLNTIINHHHMVLEQPEIVLRNSKNTDAYKKELVYGNHPSVVAFFAMIADIHATTYFDLNGAI